MEQKISEYISVSTIFDHKSKKTHISKILWKNKVYKIEKHGFLHTYKKGDVLFHVFSVTSNTISFKISFDSTSLIWKLEEIYDQNIG